MCGIIMKISEDSHGFPLGQTCSLLLQLHIGVKYTKRINSKLDMMGPTMNDAALEKMKTNWTLRYHLRIPNLTIVLYENRNKS